MTFLSCLICSANAPIIMFAFSVLRFYIRRAALKNKPRHFHWKCCLGQKKQEAKRLGSLCKTIYSVSLLGGTCCMKGGCLEGQRQKVSALHVFHSMLPWIPLSLSLGHYCLLPHTRRYTPPSPPRAGLESQDHTDHLPYSAHVDPGSVRRH